MGKITGNGLYFCLKIIVFYFAVNKKADNSDYFFLTAVLYIPITRSSTTAREKQILLGTANVSLKPILVFSYCVPSFSRLKRIFRKFVF